MQTALIRVRRRVTRRLTRIKAVWHSDNSFTNFERHWSTLKIEADEKFGRGQFIWRAKGLSNADNFFKAVILYPSIKYGLNLSRILSLSCLSLSLSIYNPLRMSEENTLFGVKQYFCLSVGALWAHCQLILDNCIDCSQSQLNCYVYIWPWNNPCTSSLSETWLV